MITDAQLYLAAIVAFLFMLWVIPSTPDEGDSYE